MQKAIISDTSCIIILDKIGELDVLRKLFGKIITTPEIEEEFGNHCPIGLKKEVRLTRFFKALLNHCLIWVKRVP